MQCVCACVHAPGAEPCNIPAPSTFSAPAAGAELNQVNQLMTKVRRPLNFNFGRNWDCPQCGNLVFGSKLSCMWIFPGGRVCGARMPASTCPVLADSPSSCPQSDIEEAENLNNLICNDLIQSIYEGTDFSDLFSRTTLLRIM